MSRVRGGAPRTRNPRRPTAQPKRPPSWLRQHWRLVLGSVLALGVVIGLGVAAYVSPALSVREITVAGNDSVSRDEILKALDVPVGLPLLQVDTSAAANRVANILPIAEAKVQREYPSTLAVTVSERVAVAYAELPDGTHLLDANGISFRVAPPPPGLPLLETEKPQAGDRPTVAALKVLAALSPPLRIQVKAVTAETVSSIKLVLVDDRIVVWGTEDRAEDKSSAALALLTQPGTTYDVSSPDLATVK